MFPFLLNMNKVDTPYKVDCKAFRICPRNKHQLCRVLHQKASAAGQIPRRPVQSVVGDKGEAQAKKAETD
jgi:hypothetical protein